MTDTICAARCLLAARGVPLSARALAGAMLEANHYELVRGLITGLANSGKKSTVFSAK